MSFRKLALAVLVATASVHGRLVQLPSLKLPSDAAVHRQSVRDIFSTSFDAYKKIAFPHDDLTPVSKSFTDGRNGWGASVVDAMSTMVRNVSIEVASRSLTSIFQTGHNGLR